MRSVHNIKSRIDKFEEDLGDKKNKYDGLLSAMKSAPQQKTVPKARSVDAEKINAEKKAFRNLSHELPTIGLSNKDKNNNIDEDVMIIDPPIKCILSSLRAKSVKEKSEARALFQSPKSNSIPSTGSDRITFATLDLTNIPRSSS